MANNKLKKVLIANRGEISLRIKKAANALGIQAVTVASEQDKGALFAREADELVVIGGAEASDSYLNIDKLIKAARETGADCIHPGYGFLSENAEFAKAVVDAGLVFVGPTAESIEIMGSKTEARKRVAEFGVPLAPAITTNLDDKKSLIKQAKEIGFPLIIKAVAGGGGRGMRIVRSEQNLEQELPRARAEAQKFFSNQEVYLEKYVEQPRHVEVQVFGDSHGNVLHFGTRECSVQRRHQKVIEEAPAPNLSLRVREGLHQAAIKAAQSVNYRGAGTVEFLVKDDRFYFLEMNTRIQVEHPVTEMVTGVDLVQLQFKEAAGQALPYAQNEVQTNGHSVEFRIYAEDPQNNFMPSLGVIKRLEFPELEGVRVDKGFSQGDEISRFYDPMIAKLIVTADDRKTAIERSYQTLLDSAVEGINTNLVFHRWLLRQSSFRLGEVDIGWLEREFSAESIIEQRAAEVRDPLHKPPIGGAQMKNFYEYRSEKYNQTYTIEVLHRRDGFFLAIPVDQRGRRAKNKNCRMSNGLNTVVRSLISDVLEKTPPQELFGE